jgi:glycerophosphoryl diester phosphodiesterase
VVIHDERIDRVSNGTGWVKDFTLEELRRFDVNKNFPAYGRAEIPTLAEVLDLLKATGMTINLELKNSRIFYENLEEKVLKMVEEKGLEDHVIYSSFNHSSMCKIKERKPSAPAAFLYSDGIADIAEYAGRYRMDAVHPSVGNALYPGVVEACHAKKIKVHVWTVNEETDFDRMRALGADAVITNYVEKGC